MSGFHRTAPRSAEIVDLDMARRARRLPEPPIEACQLPPPGKRRGDVVLDAARLNRGIVLAHEFRHVAGRGLTMMLAVQFPGVTRVLPVDDVVPLAVTAISEDASA